MKTTYYISIFLILLTGIVSCGKNKTTTVSGRLMQSCDTPAANKKALIHINGGGILAKPIVTLDFTTDENGYFSVTHDESFHRFSVRTSNSFSVLEVDNYDAKNKELGEVYINMPLANYYLYLDLDSSYSELDTLRYYDWNYPQNGESHWIKSISGPFINGLMDSVTNAPNMHAMPIRWTDHKDGNDPEMPLFYSLNGDSYELNISTPFCSESKQIVKIKIE